MGYRTTLGPPGDDMGFASHMGYLLMHGSSLQTGVPDKVAADGVAVGPRRKSASSP